MHAPRIPGSTPSPLDEYPIHQTPLPMTRVASSDRNFYDRSYFNAHNRDGATMHRAIRLTPLKASVPPPEE